MKHFQTRKEIIGAKYFHTYLVFPATFFGVEIVYYFWDSVQCGVINREHPVDCQLPNTAEQITANCKCFLITNCVHFTNSLIYFRTDTVAKFQLGGSEWI